MGKKNGDLSVKIEELEKEMIDSKNIKIELEEKLQLTGGKLEKTINSYQNKLNK